MSEALLAAFYVVMAVSLLFAWLRGGATERVGVLLLVGFFAFRVVLRPLIPAHFDEVDLLAFAQDLLGFVGFVWIGLRARRYWPLVAAALQLLSLSAHFARALRLPVDPWAYALLKSFPTLMIYIVLAIGTVSYQRRVRAWKRARSFPDCAGPVMGHSWRRHTFRSAPLGVRRSSSPFTTKEGAISAHSSVKGATEESSSTTVT